MKGTLGTHEKARLDSGLRQRYDGCGRETPIGKIVPGASHREPLWGERIERDMTGGGVVEERQNWTYREGTGL
jgi:hypothetical protein